MPVRFKTATNDPIVKIGKVGIAETKILHIPKEVAVDMDWEVGDYVRMFKAESTLVIEKIKRGV